MRRLAILLVKIMAMTALCISTIAIASTTTAIASTTNYPQKIFFNDLLKNSDVGIGEVEVVFQDSYGFIWLGGRNALARYDGYSFHLMKIRMDPNDPSKDIQAGHVVYIFEASNGRLWIASRKGTLWLDREKDLLRPLNKTTDQQENIDVEAINAITEAPSGEIIVGAYGGMYIVDPNTNRVKIVPHDAHDLHPSNALNDEVVHDFLWSLDRQYLWISTRKGITRLEWSTQTYTHFIPHEKKPESLPENEIWVMALDRQGNIWAGSHSGVYLFSTLYQKYTRKYVHDAEDKFSLGNNLTRNILIDSKGWVWIGSDGGGINLYDRENNRFLSFKADSAEKGSLASNSIRAMYEDQNGDIWIGTYPEGMNFFDQSLSALSSYTHNTQNKDSIPHNSVLTLQEDKLGNLWIGTDGGGVSYFNRHENTFKHYQVENGKVSSNAILTSFIDKQDRLWIGTWGAGALLYNEKTDSFDQIPFDPSLKGKGSGINDALNDEAIWAITQDKDGYMWFGTHGGGLSQYDEKTQRFVNFSQDRENDDTLSNQLVWAIYEDSKGQLWIGTSNGLNRYDPINNKFIRYYPEDLDETTLSHNSIISIYEDYSGEMWFGTDRGINKLNQKTGRFKQYTKSSGFVDDGIRSIEQDADGDIWMGTNNGVVRFNPNTEEVTNYEYMAGDKLGTFNTAAILKSIRDEIILGSSNGLRIFDVPYLTTNTKPPKIVLTEFSVFTKPISIDDDSNLLQKEVNLVDTITLDHTRNMFAFQFAALNYRDAELNEYAYKLEGFDDNWREVGKNRQAIYTNLDGGTYIFKVRGSNNDGIWNDAPKEIRLVQLPPPWKTWWAYTLYALAIIGAIAQFIHSQHRKRKAIEEQNERLEQTVALRTQELSKKNNDIRTMLENMQQGLFTIEPTGKIHSEYSKFLEEIFGTSDIAGKDAIDLLFNNINNLGTDLVNQIQEGLSAMLGEDIFNFEMNEHIFPHEYKIIHERGVQHLSLDWDPIVNNDDMIEKVMVSVRDTTQLKLAEADADKQKRELKIIAELIKIPHKKYLAFEESAFAFLEENTHKVARHEARDDELIALLFRNMHTIKGNCRTFGLSHLSNIVHDVETYYSELKSDPNLEWDKERITHDIQAVKKAIDEYSHVYFSLLDRGSSAEVTGTSNFLDAKTAEHIKNFLKEASSAHPEVSKSIPLQSAHILLDIALSSTLTNVLADVVGSLPNLAKQLGKTEPQVIIKDSNIRIRNDANELIVNVFTHLLRNSLDHGLESPEERIKAEKTPAGVISVTTSTHMKKLCIHLSDDGKGLNIDRLLEKGRTMGKWLDRETPPTKEIANFIFASGASTKDEVTDISGRGVGMDAVKQFLRDAGGDIELHLLAPKSAHSAYVPFETIVTLPTHTFTSIQFNL